MTAMVSDWSIWSVTVATIVVLSTVHIVLKFLALFLQRQRDIKALHDFKGPPELPLLGNLKDLHLGGNDVNHQVKLMEQYGYALRLFVGPFAASVTLGDPDLIKLIISASAPKDAYMYSFIKPWIGDGLLVSKGQKWFRNRKLLTPAFHFEILKPYVTVFCQSTQILVKKWQSFLDDGVESIEMFEHVSLMTLDSLLKCAFGYKSQSQTEGTRSPYISAVYQLADLLKQRFQFFPHHNDLLFYFSPSGFKFRKACGFVHKYAQNIIEARQQQQKSGANTDNSQNKCLDFLDILLQARDEDGKGLTTEEIRHEVDTFLFEGHDTTASAISWILYNLAKHPDHQIKCRAEVQQVLGDRDDVTWDDLSNLSYLTLCIKESLRTHPPVPNISRRILEDIQLPDGRTLSAGMWIGISMYGVHHNPTVWKDPYVYDPSRFTPENSQGRSSYAFIPFSAGQRNCIGQNFAMAELKTCIAMLLKHFEFRVDTSKPFTIVPELVLRCKGGLWLKVLPVK